VKKPCSFGFISLRAFCCLCEYSYFVASILLCEYSNLFASIPISLRVFFCLCEHSYFFASFLLSLRVFLFVCEHCYIFANIVLSLQVSLFLCEYSYFFASMSFLCWYFRAKDAASVPETHSAHFLPYYLEPTRRKCSHIKLFLVGRNRLWYISRLQIFGSFPRLVRPWHDKPPTHFRVSPKFQTPSGGTITTDRCLTHIRDAAHSESILISLRVFFCLSEYSFVFASILLSLRVSFCLCEYSFVFPSILLSFRVFVICLRVLFCLCKLTIEPCFWRKMKPYSVGLRADLTNHDSATHSGKLRCWWFRVAVRCGALQCVAVCCSDVHRVAVFFKSSWAPSHGLRYSEELRCLWFRVVVCCSVLQCVGVRCSILQSYEHTSLRSYGVAYVSRMFKIIGLFCKRAP